MNVELRRAMLAQVYDTEPLLHLDTFTRYGMQLRELISQREVKRVQELNPKLDNYAAMSFLIGKAIRRLGELSEILNNDQYRRYTAIDNR